jgi:hypothetical protein
VESGGVPDDPKILENLLGKLEVPGRLYVLRKARHGGKVGGWARRQVFYVLDPQIMDREGSGLSGVPGIARDHRQGGIFVRKPLGSRQLTMAKIAETAENPERWWHENLWEQRT